LSTDYDFGYYSILLLNLKQIADPIHSHWVPAVKSSESMPAYNYQQKFSELKGSSLRNKKCLLKEKEPQVIKKGNGLKSSQVVTSLNISHGTLQRLGINETLSFNEIGGPYFFMRQGKLVKNSIG